MTTNTEFLRNRLLTAAGIIKEKAPYEGLSYEDLWQKECNDKFCEMMDNRLCMGLLRYGPIESEKPEGYDLKKIDTCIENYKKTGNTEYLVDAANYCRLEHRRGKHPTKHFKVIDR